MTPATTVLLPEQARTASSTQQERERLRQELLRRIIDSEMRRQAVRITPH